MLTLSWLETRRVTEAMREVGAISPATARRARHLPEIVQTGLERYVHTGVVREGAPGTFYLFEGKAQPMTPGQLVKLASFWLLVILMPVIILQLANSRTPAPTP